MFDRRYSCVTSLCTSTICWSKLLDASIFSPDTTHSGHGKEIAATLPLAYDAIITISGDGLPYEVINGLAERKDARQAFQKISVVPLPGGSANAFCINLLGVKVWEDSSMRYLTET